MRQSGRTTRTLQEANEAKKRGERVLIVAPNQSIQDHMIMTARKLGLLQGTTVTGYLDRQKDFAVVGQIVESRYRGFVGSIHEDHTVKEMLIGPKASRYYREIDMMMLFRQPKVTVPRWKFQPF
jgi:hypothetical protein